MELRELLKNGRHCNMTYFYDATHGFIQFPNDQGIIPSSVAFNIDPKIRSNFNFVEMRNYNALPSPVPLASEQLIPRDRNATFH
jgi:hypothetical protein